MPINKIRQTTDTMPNAPTDEWAYVEVVSDVLQFNSDGANTRSVVSTAQTQTLTNKTLTSPTLTTPTVTNPTIDGLTPISITTTPITFGATHKNRTTVADKVDGIAFTLPAATGTGNVYRVVIGTALTSATITVTAAGSDKYFGGVVINDRGDSTAATSDFFPATAGTSTIFTLTQSIGAGAAGDIVSFEDVKTARWSVSGVLTGETDPANPFS